MHASALRLAPALVAALCLAVSFPSAAENGITALPTTPLHTGLIGKPAGTARSPAGPVPAFAGMMPLAPPVTTGIEGINMTEDFLNDDGVCEVVKPAAKFVALSEKRADAVCLDVQFECVFRAAVAAALAHADFDVRPPAAAASRPLVEQLGNPRVYAHTGDVEERTPFDDPGIDGLRIALERSGDR